MTHPLNRVSTKPGVVHTDNTGPVDAVGWSPDSTRLATAGHDGTVRLWDPTTAATLALLTGHTNAVRAVAWSPDGACLVTVGDDRTLRVWDATRATCVAMLRVEAPLFACAFSPDARLFAASGQRGTYLFRYQQQ